MKITAPFLNFLFIGLFALGLTNNESMAQPSNEPKFAFKAENNRITLDTMFLEMMEDVNLEIEFENKGNKPLIVMKVNGCCGTHIKGWTKKPILPKEKGSIKVQFMVPPRPHQISRNVKVVTNDPSGVKTLYIKGIVAEPKDGSINLNY